MNLNALSMMSPTQLIMLVIVGVVLVFSLFGILAVLISIMNYEETPVHDRLRMLKDNGTFEGAKRKTGPFDDLKELLLKVAEPLSQKLYGANQKTQKQVKSLLAEAGLPDNDTQMWRFMTQRVSTGIVLGLIGLVVGIIFSGGLFMMIIMGGLGGFMIGSMVPMFQLRGIAAKRKQEIRFTLPDTLDLMVVCVEAGLGLDSTLQRVAEETDRMAPDISHEFKRLNKELNAGISRMDAFQNMGQRAGVDELRSLCAMVIQADKMGTSVADTLRVYADDLRTKRRQRAEELASKASIKMTFPLVLFIFPPLFIVLMGPIVITTLQSFFPAK